MSTFTIGHLFHPSKMVRPMRASNKVKTSLKKIVLTRSNKKDVILELDSEDPTLRQGRVMGANLINARELYRPMPNSMPNPSWTKQL